MTSRPGTQAIWKADLWANIALISFKPEAEGEKQNMSAAPLHPELW
jgi:hypothetical protein